VAVKTKRAVAVEILGPLVDSLTLQDESSKRRKPNTFHASSIEDCCRQQWYGVQGYLPEEDDGKNPHWKRSAEAGNSLHEMWQARLIRSGVVMTTAEFFAATGWDVAYYTSHGIALPEYAEEIPLPANEYRIGGRIDLAVMINGEPMITDIKTVDQKKFDQGASGYKFKKYRAQLQIYMHFTGFRQSLVLLVNRNDLTQKEYLIDYDEEWCITQLGRIMRLNDMVKRNVLPSPEPEFFACRFCPFNMLCSENYKEGPSL